MPVSIVGTGLSFSWPDGTEVFAGLNFAIGPGRTGLVGSSGAGKSTLLRLVTGELRPRSGTIRAGGEVGHLPQELTRSTGTTVAGLLGIAPARRALQAIERGSVDPADFAAVGTDWDVEERAAAELARLGLDPGDLDRPVGQLSGGETVLTRLAALFLRRPDVLLLDEPTNNLDAAARDRLYTAVSGWPGLMLIVSHDRDLLDRMDQIAEIARGSVRVFGGNFSAYCEQVAAEREAAGRAVRTATAEVRRQQRELIETQVRLDRRQRFAKKAFENTREPRAVMRVRKLTAQVSAAKLRDTQQDRLAGARDRLAGAKEAAREGARIRIALPGTAVPVGRTVLTVQGLAGDGWRPVRRPPAGAGAENAAERLRDGRPAALDELIVRGPERLALTGPNGSGKTTLLRAVAGVADRPGLAVHRRTGGPGGTGGVGYLPQRLDLLDDSLSVLDNVRAAAPDAPVNDVRANLARFLFRGDRTGQLAGSLSGGERFRATLATLLLADPPPQLLLLDEPTNNLDLDSVRQLASALENYQGAMIIASHDRPFLDEVRITRWLHLDPSVGLTEAGTG